MNEQILNGDESTARKEKTMNFWKKKDGKTRNETAAEVEKKMISSFIFFMCKWKRTRQTKEHDFSKLEKRNETNKKRWTSYEKKPAIFLFRCFFLKFLLLFCIFSLLSFHIAWGSCIVRSIILSRKNEFQQLTFFFLFQFLFNFYLNFVCCCSILTIFIYFFFRFSPSFLILGFLFIQSWAFVYFSFCAFCTYRNGTKYFFIEKKIK